VFHGVLFLSASTCEVKQKSPISEGSKCPSRVISRQFAGDFRSVRRARDLEWVRNGFDFVVKWDNTTAAGRTIGTYRCWTGHSLPGIPICVHLIYEYPFAFVSWASVSFGTRT